MSDRIHRLSMFIGGLCSGFVGITGVGNLVDVQIIGWIAIAGTTVILTGNLIRIYFPESAPPTT